MPEMTLQQRRMELARASRRASQESTAQSSAEIERIRRDYAAAKLADYIRRTVAAAPPLSPEQQHRLALLLGNGNAA